MWSRVHRWLRPNPGPVRQRVSPCRPLVEWLEPRLAPSAIPVDLGVNVPITTDPGVQQMPTVVADPRDAKHLVIAYLDYSLLNTGYPGVGVAVSHDAGATWQRSAVPLAPGFDEGAGNPAARFDAQGHLFVTYMAATFFGPKPGIINPSTRSPTLHVRERTFGFQSNNGIFVVRSEDGGLTWDRPVAVAENLYDGQHKVPYEIMPDLAIDTSAALPDGRPNPNYGNLYDVWARYYPSGQYPGQPQSTGGSQFFFAVSRDGGATWQIQLKPPSGTAQSATALDTSPDTGVGLPEGTGYAFWSHLSVGPDGSIYVADSQAGFFAVHRSADGGKTFTDPNDATGAYYPFGNAIQVFPNPTLNNSQFRLVGVRDVVADPTRPGTLYVADQLPIADSTGDNLDEGDIIFARSTDYGVTWQTTFQVGTHAKANVLNDDNLGDRTTGQANDVTEAQVFPRLATDPQGDIALVWYDTRRDPADHNLDVFATVSTDGGQTFSPNFRVTDQSFNPDAGKFTDGESQPDYYLGDSIGLALSNGTAYAAWTDTRAGNQDIYFSSFPLNPPPAPLSNRFAPNATAATATNFGKLVARNLPKLTIASGDEEWFRFQAAATGSVTVTATLAEPADAVRLELYDASGTTLLASGSALLDPDGQVSGQRLAFPGQSGETYLVRVLPGPAAPPRDTPAVYTLDLQSLSSDLGSQVYGVTDGTLPAGQDAYYALSVPASGSLEVTLTPGASAQGNFHLELRDANTLAVQASGHTVGTTQDASLPVTGGQSVYFHVFGDAGAQGDYTLTFTNLDQFTTQNNKILNFPIGDGPSAAVLADLSGNGRLDIVVSHIGENVVSVLLNNGDGTFQAPRDYAVGAFTLGTPSTLIGLPNYRRALAVADLNGDGIPDIVVANHDSGDLSILFGRGDGTFAPQRRVAATAAPFSLGVGDVNGDGIQDLVVGDSTAGPTQGVVLLGRGDGTFAPPIPLGLPFGEAFDTANLQLADLNHDGKLDIVYRNQLSGTFVMLGNGDGTFGPPVPIQPRTGSGLTVADLNGDGNLDVVGTDPDADNLYYNLGNGDGTFQPVQEQGTSTVGRAPVAVAVTDFGSALPDGSLGPPDGQPDLIVADAGTLAPAYTGPPEVILLPAQVDNHGQFAGFGNAIPLAMPKAPLDVQVGDLNGDGVPDVVVVDADGVEVIFGKRPVIASNTTPQTARSLGTVVHTVEPAQTLVPGHAEAYYTFAVPTEAARGAGDEGLDFSGLFQAEGEAGISMDVRDAAGNLLGSGERFRVVAPQGVQLMLHVFGEIGPGGERGTGAFTLDIDALPQVVSVEAQPLLPGVSAAPGGPTASLVLTFQGDRLDPATAQDPANYSVTYLGPQSPFAPGTAQVIPVAAAQGAVYDPSTNVNVASGAVYPTAVRQTVTLVFDQPLLAGAYQVEVAPAVQADPFNAEELGLLSGGAGFIGHPVVSADGSQVTAGSQLTVADLVSGAGALGDLGALAAGTPFLTQLHDDLGALLDAGLTRLGDDPAIPAGIDSQILARFAPALGPPDQRPVAALVIWLDPPSIGLVDARGERVVYDLPNNSYRSTLQQGYVSVAGNVEVLVLPFAATAAQTYLLNVADVPPTARGGAVFLGRDGSAVTPLTAGLRAGTTQFRFSFGVAAVAAVLPRSTASAGPPAPAPPPAVEPSAAGNAPGAAAATNHSPAAGPNLSQAAALVAIGSRGQTAPVIAIAPRLDVQVAAVSSGPDPASAPAAQGALAAAVANSGGAGDKPPPLPDRLVAQVRTVLNELGRPFLRVLGPVRALFGGLGANVRALLRAIEPLAPPAGGGPGPALPGRTDAGPERHEGQAETLPPEVNGAGEALPADCDQKTGARVAAALVAAGAVSASNDARRDDGPRNRKGRAGRRGLADA